MQLNNYHKLLYNPTFLCLRFDIQYIFEFFLFTIILYWINLDNFIHICIYLVQIINSLDFKSSLFDNFFKPINLYSKNHNKL